MIQVSNGTAAAKGWKATTRWAAVHHPAGVAQLPVHHLGVQAGSKIVEVLASHIQPSPHLQGHHRRGQDLRVGMLQRGARDPRPWLRKTTIRALSPAARSAR
jgi:hypothetical protein